MTVETRVFKEEEEKTKRLKIVDFSLEVNCSTICEQIKTDSLITHCFEICSICFCVGMTN